MSVEQTGCSIASGVALEKCKSKEYVSRRPALHAEGECPPHPAHQNRQRTLTGDHQRVLGDVAVVRLVQKVVPERYNPAEDLDDSVHVVIGLDIVESDHA